MLARGTKGVKQSTAHAGDAGGTCSIWGLSLILVRLIRYKRAANMMAQVQVLLQVRMSAGAGENQT